ncbi:YbhB/YbcL family Raf kinase inhibitor-like protein [Leptolinea tardivitalis]|uniref:YbhB/YbcL family Raf kinase inhibitor-like protein n=1 Tax=Leptolinea tardivitalis TaxID=229920 RepID=UPI0007803ACD|nr:YbhB/YbcL family Raf kinase inhibitor-like protein [Leptolinea tardivitalis]GAP22449.1 Raf kinase inhibitor-like protein, YbhB/YbcL family [Leptolinea tardivitalis]
MMPIYIQLPLGLILAGLIAAAAYFARALNRSGALAAFILGTVIFGIGGLNWAVLLLAFFLSSSFLSILFKHQKKAIAANFSKGSQRDAGQVAANGAIAGLCALLFPLLGQPVWLWAACAGALAAANADTWGTEIGILSKSKPRLITTGKPVDTGTSGGITWTGILAAFSGSLLIGLLAVLVKPAAITNSLENNILLPIIVTLAGLAGSLIDSWIGATNQAMYYCDICQKATEKHPLHGCGNPTRLLRGAAWLNNDWVNTFCTFCGGLLAALIAYSLISSSLPLVSDGGVDMMKLTVTSPAFAYNQPIPQKFTCDGENKSPALTWSDIPASTRSLALIVDDPDAPMGTYTHWVVYNLPPSLVNLPEGIPVGKMVNGGSQGINSSRTNGYFGPCPPAGKPHRYFFKLYATDIEPTLPDGLTSERLAAALSGHILASGEWMGTYSR